MRHKNFAMFTIVAASIIMTLGILTIPAFADKCDKNEDRNCNNSEKDQKLSATNDCNIKNHNHDKSHDNTNLNTDDGLSCISDLANKNDVNSGLLESDSASTAELKTSSVGNESQTTISGNETQSSGETQTFALPM
ncbi:MAG: hypothetical protein WBQ16_07500 [Nitrososphaeraceae archaeon]